MMLQATTAGARMCQGTFFILIKKGVYNDKGKTRTFDFTD